MWPRSYFLLSGRPRICQGKRSLIHECFLVLPIGVCCLGLRGGGVWFVWLPLPGVTFFGQSLDTKFPGTGVLNQGLWHEREGLGSAQGNSIGSQAEVWDGRN